MALDPNIILRGSAVQQEIQQQNNAGLQKLIGTLGQIGYDSKVRKMRQLANPEDQQAFANNSLFANKLNTQLAADKAAAAKAANDQLVFNANLIKAYSDIGKTDSETLKNKQQAGGYGLDNAGKVGSAVQKAIGFGATTGNKQAIIDGLNIGKSTGEITPEAYQTAITALGNLNSIDDIKKFGLAMLDPKYSLTTADNVLDNKTQIYKTDKDYQLGQQELQVKQVLEQQKIDLEQNKGEIMAGADGMAYIFMPNQPPDKSYKPLLGPDGKHAKAPAANSGKGGMSATAQKELFEVTDSISAAQNGIENLRAALNYSKTAYDGFGATQRAAVAGNFTDSEAATATAMLNNIVTGNALEMLKATFGGAPTEGERAILLQLQGSANLPRQQREAIYNRAIQMAERRLQSNQAKAEGIRNGSYFQSQQGGSGTGGASLSYFK